MKYFIGVDIGGTKCSVSLANADKGIRILNLIRFPSNAELGAESMISRIMEALDKLIADSSLSKDDITAIGISCGGPLDSASGRVLSPPNLPGWDDIHLTDLLEKRFGIPAYLQNDANACALAEWKLGAGRGTKDMVFLTMGTGMGAGILSNGRLITGTCDLAGEVGHIRLTDEGPEGYGKNGSFEGWCSGSGIERFIKEWTRRRIAAKNPPAWVKDGRTDIDAKLLNEYAGKSDEDALALFNLIGDRLGRALAIILDMLNPEVIVIGSVFQRAEAWIRPAMEKALKEEALPLSLSHLKVLPAQMGDNIGDYAAIMAAVYALDIDPMQEVGEEDERVLAHLTRLSARYPHLAHLSEDIVKAYTAIRNAYAGGNKLLVCGNGGSCADCEHIVGELMKGFYLKRPVSNDPASVLSHLQGALPAIALTGHPALSTAFANDEDAAYLYAQQTLGYGKKGDVLLAISTSGNALNVINAVMTAKELGLVTIALTGGNGGRLASMADYSIIAPGNCPADVQENHLPVYHTICAMLEAKFFKE